ncbi:MAG: beta-CASP ribonuclease aCPSF1 [Candidatus Aenigmarchaeota archaeon]|nr:beta-CASP ribonuclease aCPSF1 [Candidatus Aenigmarchaeota archaeon]
MKIIEKIKSELPENAMISDMCYEGCEVILYTENKEFFRNCTTLIKKIVDDVKKRIEVRADPAVVMDEEKTAEFIKKVVSKDAGIRDIYFEPEFAKVVIHAEKPGLVIGKNGATMAEIKDKTYWTPDIKRAPVIDSEVIRKVRKMLHMEAGYRKKFLNELGKKIYSEGKEVDWIRAVFLGGFREVGRSCILLQTPQSNVLMDCGISVSSTQNPFPHLELPEFQIQALDAVIVSHSHMDHIGLVPFLYEHGYRGPVYCTKPTRDLGALLHIDYLNICKRENAKPPFTIKGIEEMIKHCVALEYGEVTDITPDMRLTLENSGHLLGSSLVHVHIGNGLYNLLYTGDVKYDKSRLFDPAFTNFTRVEGLIIESTYGSENVMSRDESEKILIDAVKRTLARDGRVLIPTFAVGRAQEIIAILTDSDVEGPIYLDGMLWDATAIHTAYPEFMSKTMQTKILHKGKNPFLDPRLKGIGSQKERKEVLDSTKPAVILSTSGMLTAGPALEYLMELSEDPKNALIFVGYQGEGTLGRRIQKGWKHVQFENGIAKDLKLEIVTVEGLGGHSDQQELVSFVEHLPAKPRKIIINHGESSRSVELAKMLHKTFRTETVAPRILETIRLK